MVHRKIFPQHKQMQHIFDTYGADALRFYLFDSPVSVGETIIVDEKGVLDAQRNVVMTLWNSFRFFELNNFSSLFIRQIFNQCLEGIGA